MITPLRLLQVNLNHCAQAQDLLIQSMAQWSIEVAVVAEPYRVPARKDWIGDAGSSIALFLGPRVSSIGTIKSQDFVASIVGGLMVVGVYFSPSRTHS